jgi:hypothetical protein
MKRYIIIFLDNTISTPIEGMKSMKEVKKWIESTGLAYKRIEKLSY